MAQWGRHPDGSTKVDVPKRVWRPQMKSTYVEPAFEHDPSSSLDWIFEGRGKALSKEKTELTPRNDLISFDPTKHSKEIKAELQFRDCPPQWQPVIEVIVRMFWDVFSPEGLQNPIRGFQFSIDTGAIEPVCCKPPRYGPHEARIIDKLSAGLDEMGITEDDFGPWGALCVLAAKPNQEHVHWSEYVFRLCVSYRKLNAVTRPFAFPITRCDDAILKMESRKFNATTDLNSGYWQMTMDTASEEKTAYFISEGKKHFKRMPMGIKNAAPAFTQMIIVLEKNWKAKYNMETPKYVGVVLDIIKKLGKGEQVSHLNSVESHIAAQLKDEIRATTVERECEIGDPGSACIIDDVIAFSHSPITLLAYLIAMFEVFQHHSVTVKLRKTRFLPTRAEFVGYDLLADGNAPSVSKHGPIKALGPPKLFSDLRMIIGLLGFYQQWMPPFEPRILGWREYIKMRPPPGTTHEEEHRILTQLWQPSDTVLLEDLKQELIDGPILKRPDFKRRFYLKTDWSRKAMCAVVLQADCTEEAEAAQRKELEGSRKCDFDKTLGGLRLRPCHIIARTCKGNETEWHSATGELATGHYAMCNPQLQVYLWLKEFTWLTDCSGNIRDKEAKYPPKHVEARWAMDMMRFDYTIVHRPERMMFECNLLSRYNTWTSKARADDNGTEVSDVENKESTTETPPLTLMTCLTHYLSPSRSNPMSRQCKSIRTDWATQPEKTEPIRRSYMAEITDRMRDIWILGAEMETVSEATKSAGLEPRITAISSEDSKWQAETNTPNLQHLLNRLRMNPLLSTEWICIPKAAHLVNTDKQIVQEILAELIQRNVNAIIMCFSNSSMDENKMQWTETMNTWREFIQDLRTDWDTESTTMNNIVQGGPIEKQTRVLISSNRTVVTEWKRIVQDGSSQQTHIVPMKPYLDPPNTKYDDYISTSNFNVTERQTKTHGPHVTRTAHIEDGNNQYIKPVFDPDGPAPDLESTDTGIRQWNFLVDTFDGDAAVMIRPVRFREKCRLMGISTHDMYEAETLPEELVDTHLRRTTPKNTWKEIFSTLYQAEMQVNTKHTESLTENLTPEWNDKIWNEIEEKEAETMANYLDGETTPSTLAFLSTFTTQVINRWTTLPVPTDDTWREEYEKDTDTAYMIKQITANHKVKYATLTEGNKSYFKQWIEGKLEVVNGILYQWEEPRATKIRQLRRRVVPKGLRRSIIVAYHATPLAGHVGIYKTYWRIVT